MSELINKIVQCKNNDWGIWDPVPNALDWCPDGPIEVASEVAKSNKEYVESNHPEYIKNSAGKQLGKCVNWKKKPTLRYKTKDLVNTVPYFSSGETNFRFIIITAGPPGSGKSAMNNIVKRKARAFNLRAAQKDWAKIGHDFVIGNDEKFNDVLKELTNTIDSTEGLDHKDIYI